MISIRQGVFETNSSSSHSFSLTFNTLNKNPVLSTIEPNEDGRIILTGGNYTYSVFLINTAIKKANLIAAAIVVYGDEDLKIRFDRVLKEHTGATEIVYDVRPVAVDGKVPNTFFSTQVYSSYSCSYDEETDEEYERNFRDILADDNLMKLFIFNDKAYFDVGIHEC